MEKLIESYPVTCGHSTPSHSHWVAVKYDEDRDTRVLWYLLDVISQFVQWKKPMLAHSLVSVEERKGNVTVVVNPDYYNEDVQWALESSCSYRMAGEHGAVCDQWNLCVEIDQSTGLSGGDSCP